MEVVARAGWIDERMADARALARHAIADAVGRWSARSAAIVTAIVIGDRAGLDDDVERRLQEAGTYHVIAISGGNIAILAGLMHRRVPAGRSARANGDAGVDRPAGRLRAPGGWRRVGRSRDVHGGRVPRRPRRRPAQSAAERARVRRRVPAGRRAVVGRRPCFRPDVRRDPRDSGGRAVAGIAPLSATPRGRLSSLFVASAATEALLLPVGAMLFSRITFAGLALNFLAIPLMAVTQVAGMAVVPAAFVARWLSLACGFVAHVGAAGLVWSADLVRFAPAATFRVAAPGWPCVAIYYVALAVALVRARARRVPLTSGRRRCDLDAWLSPGRWRPRAGDGRLHVTFLDVGQGDSAFLRFPHGGTLLVDAGGLASSGSALRHRRPRRCAAASGCRRPPARLPRPHARRPGSHRRRRRDPARVQAARGVGGHSRPALRAADARCAPPPGELGLRWTNVRTGDRANIDGVDVVVEHPEPADWERQRVRNDDSIVVDVRWRDVSIVLTGDIGKAVERAPRRRDCGRRRCGS